MNAKEPHHCRHALHEIIFEADTPAGKLFDVLLIVSILVSVVLVMLDSVAGIRAACGRLLCLGKWVLAVPTGIVTVEMAHAFRRKVTTTACPICSAEGHRCGCPPRQVLRVKTVTSPTLAC